MSSAPAHARPARAWRPALLLYGVLLGLAALLVLALGGLWELALVAAGASAAGRALEALRLAASACLALSCLLMAADLIILLPHKRRRAVVRNKPPAQGQVTVALTAFNDEASIGLAVADFASHPLVRRVIVVDNRSTDRTAQAALEAGAIVVQEPRPGYGRCVYRALQEGLRWTDTELTVLCEGDMTFRAADIDKLLAYAPHAEIVNGTRIVEQLRERQTQLTTFMYYGNFFVGKLLEAKHVGWGTFTDVGTTYKLCRNGALQELLPLLQPEVNLEFNAHFLDTALRYGFLIVECPVTFHSRIGKSKGGNASNWRALRTGLRMMWGICFGWKAIYD